MCVLGAAASEGFLWSVSAPAQLSGLLGHRPARLCVDLRRGCQRDALRCGGCWRPRGLPLLWEKTGLGPLVCGGHPSVGLGAEELPDLRLDRSDGAVLQLVLVEPLRQARRQRRERREAHRKNFWPGGLRL